VILSNKTSLISKKKEKRKKKKEKRKKINNLLTGRARTSNAECGTNAMPSLFPALLKAAFDRRLTRLESNIANVLGALTSHGLSARDDSPSREGCKSR
jgi:hypothetical protein